MDYKNGKIYRIVCEETQRVYIGSTCSTLVKRLSNHKNKIKSGKNVCACKDFINPKIFLIQDYPCDRKEQLLMRERYHMENTDCVNLKRPIVSKEERQELKLEIDKLYRSKPEIKQHYQNYRNNNKEHIYNHNKKKTTCECGSIVSNRNISTHKRSEKHKRLLGAIEL